MSIRTPEHRNTKPQNIQAKCFYDILSLATHEKKLNLRSSKVSCQVLLNKVNAMRMKSYVWDLKVQCRGIPIGLFEYISVVVQWL